MHRDYSDAVISDLRFRQRNTHFDSRGWAAVLILKRVRDDFGLFDENELDLAEAELLYILKSQDGVKVGLEEQEVFAPEDEIDKVALMRQRSYEDFESRTTENLDRLYRVIVYSSPNGQSQERKDIEKILLERSEKRDLEK